MENGEMVMEIKLANSGNPDIIIYDKASCSNRLFFVQPVVRGVEPMGGDVRGGR